jgi:hypothetical protein
MQQPSATPAAHPEGAGAVFKKTISKIFSTNWSGNGTAQQPASPGGSFIAAFRAMIPNLSGGNAGTQGVPGQRPTVDLLLRPVGCAAPLLGGPRCRAWRPGTRPRRLTQLPRSASVGCCGGHSAVASSQCAS